MYKKEVKTVALKRNAKLRISRYNLIFAVILRNRGAAFFNSLRCKGYSKAI
jgi:hypothetical protein